MANERGFAMGAAVRIRGDYEAGQLRELAKRSEDAAQTRRLLALATIYDGGARSEAAKIGGVDLQTVRDWVLAFNAVGPIGLVNRKAPGNTPLLNDAQRRSLARIVEEGPVPAAHGVVRWRLIDLARGGFDEFAIAISTQTVSRDLPSAGRRGGSCAAALHHRRYGAASDRDRAGGRARRACGAAARSGRLAPLGRARNSRQHQPHAPAAQIARAQPDRKHLAVHAGKLAVQPDLPSRRASAAAMRDCVC